MQAKWIITTASTTTPWSREFEDWSSMVDWLDGQGLRKGWTNRGRRYTLEAGRLVCTHKLTPKLIPEGESG